jgi:plasmid stabilization system protein ParE
LGRAIVRPAARRDLIRHFAYIGENSSIAAACRFLSEARDTFLELAQMPHLGAPGKSRKFPTLRMWRVRHFEKYLIFYQPIPEGVRVERVIHAAEDYTRILVPSPTG